MVLEIKYSMHIDLFFHVFSYFKVENASDCYCEQYIDKMAAEKGAFTYNLVAEVEDLQEYYNKNFNRLMLINFLPFYCVDYKDFKQRLLGFNGFTEEDRIQFIHPFIEVLDIESKFYFQYWQEKHKSFMETRNYIENILDVEFNKYSSLFNHFNKSIELYLSYSITQNGRGIYSKECLSAMAPFPSSPDEIDNTFFTALHEYTHQFTDNLINTNINISDSTHDISESLVILADYYIVNSLDRPAVARYFKWLSSKYANMSKGITHNEFLNFFGVDTALVSVLEKCLNNIPNISASRAWNVHKDIEICNLNE